MKKLSYIISESIENYLNKNLITEKKGKKKDDSDKSDKKDEKDYDENDYDEKEDESKGGKKKKKKFKKNAIKSKGGLRKDFDIEDDEKYNQVVDDQEQSSIENMLTSGFFNIKQIAKKWRPDLTDNGAQSELNKKLNHDRSDSGSIYRLKKKDVKRLRQIIASYLN